MSTNDCYELGVLSYRSRNYRQCTAWMKEALNRIKPEDEKNAISVSKEMILDYLSLATYKEGRHFEQKQISLYYNFSIFCCCHLGNFNAAIEWTDKIIEISDHDYAQKRKTKFQIKLFESNKLKNVIIPPVPIVLNTTRLINPDLFDEHEQMLYAKLCRKENIPTPSQLAPLRCRYDHGQTPFGIIAPFKLEEASMKPYIVLYYNAIFDSEIEVVKKMALARVNFCLDISISH